MDMMQVHTCNYKYNKHQLHYTHISKYGAYYNKTNFTSCADLVGFRWPGHNYSCMFSFYGLHSLRECLVNLHCYNIRIKKLLI